MKPEGGGALAGMLNHWTAAGSSPQAWMAATIAILVKTLALTPAEAVAVAAVIVLCCMSEVLEAMADAKEGKALNLKNLKEGVWRLLAYLAVPTLLACMQLAFAGGEELWETALWGSMALSASKEGATCAAELNRLGVRLPERVIRLIEGSWQEDSMPAKKRKEQDA